MRSSPLFVIAAWSLAWLPQCMRITEGIEVDVAYQPEATPSEIRTDMGYRVRLERAFIAVGQVELIRCDNFVVDLWRLVGPARARAHQLSTPTSLGVPLVLDLMESAGTPVFAGTLRPPPGDYCGIRVVGLPADADAEGLTDANAEMLQHSIFATGQVTDAATGTQWPLIAAIGESLDCEIRFDRALVFQGPTLESVSIEIDHTSWFDGIDFASLDAQAVRERVAGNVRSSLKASIPDWGFEP